MMYSQVGVDFTVITVVRNGERTIENCLKAISQLMSLAEEYKIEHIVIDGCSSDSTVSICQRYDVQLFPQEGLGIYSAMNQGLRLAKGNFIVFANADDRIIPKNFLLAMNSIWKSPETDLHLFGVHFMRHGQHVHTWLPRSTISKRSSMPYPHPGMIASASALKNKGCEFNCTFRRSADFDQALRILDRYIPNIYDLSIVEFELGGASQDFGVIVENMNIRRLNRLSFPYRIVGVVRDLYRFCYSRIRMW